ncbi:MAG: imelysin family protein [Pseudomonadota bacterium]
MRRLALVSMIMCAPISAGAVSTLTPDEAQILQEGLIRTADDFILPAYEAQAFAATTMTDLLGAYCDGDGEGDIEATREAYAATFLAWQRASVIQYGPIAEAEGPMRVQLWPDPKGFTRRAVRSALRAEDPALIEDGGLDGRSIALTGLTALEHLLFSDLEPDTYACDLATAISKFQTNLAQELVLEWLPGSAFRDDFDTAAKGNARYVNVDTVVREFLSGSVVYVDRLRKFKLLRGLGTEPGAARIERIEARKSDLGLQSIEVSFRTLRDLYDTPFGLFDVAPDIGGSTDYFLLGETASSIADTLAVETRSLSDVVLEDGAQAAELRRYADLVLYHESFLKTGFLASIGLSAGFTSADGD